MSIVVKNLNGDSSFLLTFTPGIAPLTASAARFPGAFTILISHHTSQPCVSAITELRHQPNLIIISQDKADHCHQETLCQLPPESPIPIVASPAAAKKIKSWKHFDPFRIHEFKKYDPKKADTLFSVRIPAYSPTAAPGKVTLAFLPAKSDLTGLHNAIGITYRPPGTVVAARTGNFVHLPLIPPSAPLPMRPSTSDSSQDFNARQPSSRMSMMSAASDMTSDLRSYSSASRASRQTVHRTSEKTLSVIYTPHGVAYPVVAPYAAHLESQGALPLTALFHSMTREENPWYLGGVVAAGAPGGMELARKLETRYWISAHDEDKDNRGLATTKIKTVRYNVQETRRMLEEAERKEREARQAGADESVKAPCRTEVIALETGEEARIRAW
ncbi:hypothetical protein LTR66_006179 [Elasticomyces elasticus]|nr:hypothetical protein LTR66_006179 [Elasticomyces elasticus]